MLNEQVHNTKFGMFKCKSTLVKCSKLVKNFQDFPTCWKWQLKEAVSIQEDLITLVWPTWVLIPALPSSSKIILKESLHIAEPSVKREPILTWWMWGLSLAIQIKCLKQWLSPIKAQYIVTLLFFIFIIIIIDVRYLFNFNRMEIFTNFTDSRMKIEIIISKIIIRMFVILI